MDILILKSYFRVTMKIGVNGDGNTNDEWYMSCERYLLHNALMGCSYLVLQSRNVFAYLVLGVFLPRFTS